MENFQSTVHLQAGRGGSGRPRDILWAKRHSKVCMTVSGAYLGASMERCVKNQRKSGRPDNEVVTTQVG